MYCKTNLHASLPFFTFYRKWLPLFGQPFSGWVNSEQSWKTENCLPLEQTTGLLTAFEDKNSVPLPRDRHAHCPFQNSQII